MLLQLDNNIQSAILLSMARTNTKKKKDKGIFEGIRKPVAKPTQTFKTRKDELDRKKKHKGKGEDEQT